MHFIVALVYWFYVNIGVSFLNGMLALFFPLAFLSLWGAEFALTPHLAAILAWYGHANFVQAGYMFFAATRDAKNRNVMGWIALMFSPLTVYTCFHAGAPTSSLIFTVVDYGLLALLLVSNKQK